MRRSDRKKARRNALDHVTLLPFTCEKEAVRRSNRHKMENLRSTYSPNRRTSATNRRTSTTMHRTHQTHHKQYSSLENTSSRNRERLFDNHLRDTKSEDDTAAYAQEEGEKLISDIYSDRGADIRKLAEQLHKDTSNASLTPAERVKREEQTRKQSQEIQQMYAQAVLETKVKLQFQAPDAIAYLALTIGKENAKKENQVDIDNAKKTIAETTRKLYKKSTELQEHEQKIAEQITSLMQSLKDLADMHNPGTPNYSHMRSTLDQYHQALAEVTSDPDIEKKAQKAGKEAYESEAAKSASKDIMKQKTATLHADFHSALKAISNKDLDAQGREEAVKTLLRQVIEQHTTFRLVQASAGETQFLQPEAHITKRFNEVLTSARVTHALQLAREVPPMDTQLDTQPREKALKSALKETIRYTFQANEQEKIVHQEAAKQFISQAQAGAETRQDAWKASTATAALKLEQKEHITRLEQANSEVQQALDLIQHFSPEATKIPQTFRKNFPDQRTTQADHNRETALSEIQKGKRETLTPLPKLHEHITKYVHVDTKIDPEKLSSLAKAANDELMQLGAQKASSTDIDRAAYNQLKKQISKRYDQAIQTAEDAAQNKTVKNLKALRKMAFTEAKRIYEQEAIATKIEKVQSQAQKLQKSLEKRDKKIIALNDTLRVGEQAYAEQTIRERNNQGEYLILESRMLEQTTLVQEAEVRLKTAQTNEAASKQKLKQAEREQETAKQDFNMAFRDVTKLREISDRQKEIDRPGSIVNMTNERLANTTTQLLEAQQQHTDAERETQEATRIRDRETQKLSDLEIQRDTAKKHYNKHEEKKDLYRASTHDEIEATIRFQQMLDLIKKQFRYQIRAAIIAGIAPNSTLPFAAQRAAHGQYMMMNNVLMRDTPPRVPVPRG
jgi:hypothetical protein